MSEFDFSDAVKRTIAEQHDRIAALETQNAKLRDGAAKMQQWYEDELRAALDQNAKLRELVRDYEHCNMHADCDWCKYDGTTSTHCPLSPCFPDADELRELGVEVD